jgi:hypothetical protein
VTGAGRAVAHRARAAPAGAVAQIYPNSLWVTRALAYLAITLLAGGRIRLAAQLAGALQQEGPELVPTRTHLGSRDAISEYEDMLAQIRQKLTKMEFEAAWAAG